MTIYVGSGVSKGERVQPTPEQIAASKARREAQQKAAAAAKEKVATTPKGGIWTGKPLSETWRHHISRGQVRNAATSGLLALGAGGLVQVSRQRQQPKAGVGKRDGRRDLETLGGAVAGAATMDTLNTVGGQSAKAILKERRNRRGLSPREAEGWAAHKQKVLGIPAGKAVPNDDSVPQHKKAELYRTIPKGTLPDRKANRLLAFKNTKGWTTGSLVGAGAVGALAARRRQEVGKSIDPADLPRAARRAAKKGKAPLSAEEIAQRRAEAAARAATKPKAEPPAAAAAPEAAKPHVRPRSSFLGAGQKRDLAIGVPLGVAALGYGLSPRRGVGEPEKVVKRGESDRSRQRAAGGLVLGSAGLHAAEGRQLRLSERELNRVISANNADGVGEGDFHPDQPRRDRGLHANRAMRRMDNARLLRGGKVAALGGGVLLASRVEKRDRNDNARVVAGAAGGAALLDATDTLVGAGLKRTAVLQRDWDRKKAQRTMSPEDYAARNKAQNTIIREHGEKHGLVDDRGRGRAPKPSDPHKTKNAYFRGYPTAIPGGRTQRLNALRDKKTGPILAAGALLGGGAVLNRQRVEKAVNNFAVAGGATGTGALGAYLQARRSGNKEEAKEVAGAALGGWAAQGAYQGAGYGYRNKVRGLHGSKVPRHELPHLKPNEENFPDPAERAKRAQNAKEREQLNRHHPRKADQKRNTPAHWTGSRMERRLGRTHAGKTGAAVSGLLTAAGVYGGAELASGRKKVWQREKDGVRKAVTYGYMENRRSNFRTAEMAAGAGGIAYGVSRLDLSGPAGRLERAAAGRGYGSQASQAASVARRGRDQVRRVTGRGTGLLRRIPGMGTALDTVPKHMRPAFGIGAGALLAARAHPTHDERFVPLQTGSW